MQHMVKLDTSGLRWKSAITVYGVKHVIPGAPGFGGISGGGHGRLLFSGISWH